MFIWLIDYNIVDGAKTLINTNYIVSATQTHFRQVPAFQIYFTNGSYVLVGESDWNDALELIGQIHGVLDPSKLPVTVSDTRLMGEDTFAFAGEPAEPTIMNDEDFEGFLKEHSVPTKSKPKKKPKKKSKKTVKKPAAKEEAGTENERMNGK